MGFLTFAKLAELLEMKEKEKWVERSLEDVSGDETLK